MMEKATEESRVELSIKSQVGQLSDHHRGDYRSICEVLISTETETETEIWTEF
jgi:hypothetical protein